MVIQDFCPITDEAHTELLSTLSGFEIFDNIDIRVPVDDPLPLKLKDQAAAQTTRLTDFLWIRIMKVPEVLGARSYSADADLTLEVADLLAAAAWAIPAPGPRRDREMHTARRAYRCATRSG